MKQVLVTGATGFVGSWLARRLIKEGHQVTVLCRDAAKLDADLSQNCKVAKGDITDLKSLTTAFKDMNRIYHLAGYIGYSEDLRHQMDKINVGGTQNVVDAMIEQKVPELVYMSSVVAIGASKDPEVLNEESPYEIEKLNLGYFETKRLAEEVVVKAVQEKKIKAYILNPSTIYGPGDFKKGSRKVQLKVAMGKFPVYTKGGVSVVSIHDVVEAAILVTEKGRPGERYIISGDNITIKSLFEKIAAEMGVNPPRVILLTPIVRAMGKMGGLSRESSFTSTMYHWFDNSKAKRELGLEFRSADESIHESVSWLKDHLSEFKELKK
ncbi:NAD-dependent epimerase/dehydratase family protein [bacterium]|nr:NAD-dependent epimerase/dehydratase family protein [bacterium]